MSSLSDRPGRGLKNGWVQEGEIRYVTVHKGEARATDTALLPAVPSALRSVLDLVVSGEATSRAEIARRSGLARSTVGQQVDHLVGRGILQELGSSESVRGRPPRVLTLSPRAGTIAVADVDTLESRVAIADLTGRVIAQETVDIRVDAGPEAVLETVTERLTGLLAEYGRDPDRVREVVMGLPGPVDFQRGCPVQPTGMPGWDGYPVAEWLTRTFRAPRRRGQRLQPDGARRGRPGRDGHPTAVHQDLRPVSGPGVITADGEVYRGADGAAGDIGHIRAVGGGDALCSCGNVGCVGAIASHRSILRGLGIPESTDEDPLYGVHVLAERVADNDPPAVRALRQAATEIGEIAAMLVYMFNPRTLVLGGPLSELRDDLLSGVRAAVYQRALPWPPAS